MSGNERTLRCVYVVSRYPSVTHTFIAREIAALRELGVQVQTVTIRRSESIDILSEADQAEARQTFAILPAPPWRIARAHLRAFRLGPGAYARTLREGLQDARWSDLRGLVWQLFYFAEAVILWDRLQGGDCRHLHSHHANVAADVAMITARLGNRLAPDRRWSWSMTIHGPKDFADARDQKLGLKVNRADVVIATSQHARSQLMTVADSAEHPSVRMVHCGIQAADYVPRVGEARPERALRVVSVAQLELRKGHETLFEALATLRAGGRAIELVLVGDGSQRSRLAERAGELGLDDAVVFAGAVGQDQVARFYEEADVFCLPSYAEGVPTVLMEAMASGLPVVATRIDGVPELVEDGESGLLVAPASAPQLAAALARLDDDPDLASRIGQAGRETVVSRFDMEESAKRIQALFAEVAS